MAGRRRITELLLDRIAEDILTVQRRERRQRGRRREEAAAPAPGAAARPARAAAAGGSPNKGEHGRRRSERLLDGLVPTAQPQHDPRHVEKPADQRPGSQTGTGKAARQVDLVGARERSAPSARGSE